MRHYRKVQKRMQRIEAPSAAAVASSANLAPPLLSFLAPPGSELDVESLLVRPPPFTPLANEAPTSVTPSPALSLFFDRANVPPTPSPARQRNAGYAKRHRQNKAAGTARTLCTPAEKAALLARPYGELSNKEKDLVRYYRKAQKRMQHIEAPSAAATVAAVASSAYLAPLLFPFLAPPSGSGLDLESLLNRPSPSTPLAKEAPTSVTRSPALSLLFDRANVPLTRSPAAAIAAPFPALVVPASALSTSVASIPDTITLATMSASKSLPVIPRKRASENKSRLHPNMKRREVAKGIKLLDVSVDSEETENHSQYRGLLAFNAQRMAQADALLKEADTNLTDALLTMPMEWAQAIRQRVAAFDRMKLAPVGKRRVRANVVRWARTMMAQERCTGTEPTQEGGGLPLHAPTCRGTFQLSPAMLNSSIVEFAHWRAWKRSQNKGTTLRLFNAASEWDEEDFKVLVQSHGRFLHIDCHALEYKLL